MRQMNDESYVLMLVMFLLLVKMSVAIGPGLIMLTLIPLRRNRLAFERKIG